MRQQNGNKKKEEIPVHVLFDRAKDRVSLVDASKSGTSDNRPFSNF